MATTDLCDAYEDQVKDGRVRILPPMFQIYGSRTEFSGRIATVKVFEDNVVVRKMVEEAGDGRVLVVDGGASLRCALFGGNLAQLAHINGWSGVVLNACVRDVREINCCDIGVRALGAHPLRSSKKGHGEINVPLIISGTRIVPGEWCYADFDGVVISDARLSV